jgi:hypothetical protein
MNAERKPRRLPKRLLKAFLWTSGAIALLWVCTYIYATWGLDDAQRQVRQQGRPATIAEVIDSIQEKAGSETGADLIRKAIEENERTGGPDARLWNNRSIYVSPTPLEERESIKATLARAESAIAFVERATALPPGPLSKLGSRGLDTQTIQDSRKLARLIASDVRFSAGTGNKARALNRLRTLYLLSDQLSADQVVISQLTRVALLGVADGPTRMALESLEVTPEELDELCELIGLIEANFKVAEAMVNERAVAAECFQSREEVLSVLNSDIPSTTTIPPGFSERLWWKTQSLWAELIASPVGLPARLRGATVTLQVPSEVCELVDRPPPWTSEEQKKFDESWRTFGVARLGLTEIRAVGSLRVMALAALRARQRLDLTRIMLRVQRHYVVNGKLPEKLDEVCGGPLPTIPTKWFEGKQPDYVVEKGEVFLSGSAARVQVKMRLVKK